jgi:endoglycosylceramidase
MISPYISMYYTISMENDVILLVLLLKRYQIYSIVIIGIMKMKLFILFVIAISVLHTILATQSKIKVNPVTHQFVDEFGRVNLFHGVNAVYKVAPWHPNVHGFDSNNSLSDIDAIHLKKWGFNILRLGVMWPGVEPTTRGVYDQHYLDEIEKIVINMAAQNIYVILDLHQDLWHRKFCGEGVPDYVYNICKSDEPKDTKLFPAPVGNFTSYPIDSNGDPTLDWCLETAFFEFYLSSEVGAGFQCLYDNTDNLW